MTYEVVGRVRTISKKIVKYLCPSTAGNNYHTFIARVKEKEWLLDLREGAWRG
jgi:hypothetical protein